MENHNFTKKEIDFIKTLNTPIKLQEFIDTITYNDKKRVSIADVLRIRIADCLEAASFASIVFTINGYENFIMDLEAVNDDDHVICVFKKNGLYGAVAQSKYLGLKYKSPVYKNIRELALSYFERYFNYEGELTLKNHSIPVKLPKKIDRWAFDVKYVYSLEKKLQKIKHVELIPKKIKLPLVSKETFKRETLLISKNSKVAKIYSDTLKDIKKI